MLDKIDELLKEVQGLLLLTKTKLNNFVSKFNGKKEFLNDFSKNLKSSNEQKKEFGQKSIHSNKP